MKELPSHFGDHIPSMRELREREMKQGVTDEILEKVREIGGKLSDDTLLYDLFLPRDTLASNYQIPNTPPEWKNLLESLEMKDRRSLTSAISLAWRNKYQTIGEIRLTTYDNLVKGDAAHSGSGKLTIGPKTAAILKLSFRPFEEEDKNSTF